MNEAEFPLGENLLIDLFDVLELTDLRHRRDYTVEAIDPPHVYRLRFKSETDRATALFLWYILRPMRP